MERKKTQGNLKGEERGSMGVKSGQVVVSNREDEKLRVTSISPSSL